MENSENKTGNKTVACENIRPEVLASLKSFLKILRTAYVEFRIWKIIRT